MKIVFPAERHERSFPGLPDQVAEARAFVAGCLAGLKCRDDAVLATSELVTNALLYSASGAPGGKFTVHVWRSPWSVVVHVHDQGEAAEPPAEPRGEAPGDVVDVVAEGGRGLPIVGALSTACGAAPVSECTGQPGVSGRCSWFWCSLAEGVVRRHA